MSTMTEDRVVLKPITSTDKPESSHIVMVPPGESDETPQSYVLRARIEGFPITALCGFTWVPSKDPKALPVCQECLEIYENDPNGFGDRDRLPDD